jgi:hypothetical protein
VTRSRKKRAEQNGKLHDKRQDQRPRRTGKPKRRKAEFAKHQEIAQHNVRNVVRDHRHQRNGRTM